MNRTCNGRLSARAARSSNSPSFTPTCGTQFSLTGMPLSRAARMPSMTCSNSSRAVMLWNTSGRRVSRLMFTLSRPAASRAGSCCASRMPFVVMVTLRMPGMAFSPATSWSTPLRTSGSPPVTRTVSTPHQGRQTQELFVGEHGFPLQLFHAVGHTVAAAQVAKVGDGQAQIVDIALGRIKHSRPPPGCSGRSCRRSSRRDGSRPAPCPYRRPYTYRRW